MKNTGNRRRYMASLLYLVIHDDDPDKDMYYYEAQQIAGQYAKRAGVK
jgi:hypothetical protein